MLTRLIYLHTYTNYIYTSIPREQPLTLYVMTLRQSPIINSEPVQMLIRLMGIFRRLTGIRFA